MPGCQPSCRTLLGVLAATPAASISLPLTPTRLSEWQAAVRRWWEAEARIAPAHARLDAAERLWFAVRGDTPDDLASAAWVAMERAKCEHDHQVDLHEDALDALLNTRTPNPAATIWKLGLIRTMLGPDWPELLDFLLADLHALQGGRHEP